MAAVGHERAREARITRSNVGTMQGSQVGSDEDNLRTVAVRMIGGDEVGGCRDERIAKGMPRLGGRFTRRHRQVRANNRVEAEDLHIGYLQHGWKLALCWRFEGELNPRPVG